MDRERLEQIFEETEADYSIGGDRVLPGLNILAKYTEKPVIGAAEHDKIYCSDIDDFIEEIAEEDAVQLRKLGFNIESDHDCLYHFV